MCLFQIINKRTFAGLHAIDPQIREISVAEISAFLEPSAAGSATAEPAGLLDSAALGTDTLRHGRWDYRVANGSRRVDGQHGI